MPVQTRRQEERSAATRAALLDATVACLVELGYTGTTSAAVAERAGLSRGAQLHHFGTRDQLVVAAVEHLAQKRLRSVRDQLAQLALPHAAHTNQQQPPHDSGQESALRLLAEALSGPLYAATLELWVAARSHPDLRHQLIPAEQRVNTELAKKPLLLPRRGAAVRRRSPRSRAAGRSTARGPRCGVPTGLW